MSFERDIQLFSSALTKAMDNVFKDVVIQVGDKVIGFSPVLTGRFKGNWQMTIGNPANSSLNTFDPSGSSTLAAIVADSQNLSAGQVAYIVNNLTYGYEIESVGWHSGKAPYMPVRQTETFFRDIVEEAARKFAL